MEKIATENLFLLEFLVDSVSLDQKCECDAPPGETCVSFQFLDNVPLDVCDADFEPRRNLRKGENETVKSGKSCLFSLSPQQATEALEQFDLLVCVMKKMQPGWLPEKVEIGASVISIANLFNELITSVELSDGSSPTAKTLKDIFDINDPKGTVIGKINVYIRMSCFGKLIVTQFQMNLDDKSVLFKDKEGKSLYRYKKAGKKPTGAGIGASGEYNPNCPRIPCNTMPSSGLQGGERYNSKCPEVPCDLTGAPQSQRTNRGGEYDCPFGPCGPDQPPAQMQRQPQFQGEFSTAGYPPQQGFGVQTTITPCNECGFLPNPTCLPSMAAMADNDPVTAVMPPMAPVPEGNYQEIGASMGGNSLTIRVHKDQGKVEAVDPLNNDQCICAGPVPSSGKSQQQAFALSPGGTPTSPFSFKIGQQGNPYGGGSGGGGVVVNPPVYTAPDGTQITEFSDPNKETFILRIGKKSEGVDKKNNLELELQTPKGPPLKPIPKKETRETQYDVLDAGVDESASKKSEKIKGGKKGGKGKGKGKKK